MLLPLAFAAAFLINCLARFPGETGSDSDSQYRQITRNVLDDWHPPMLARIWQALSLFGEGPGTLFVFNIAFYWLMLASFALGLRWAGRPRSAWAVLLVGATPTLLMINVNLAKDVTMAVLLLLAPALVFHARAGGGGPTLAHGGGARRADRRRFDP